MKLLYVFSGSVLFGLLHCVTGWDTYRFLTTAAIGFAFAVIFVKSGNILLTMILHFVYDFLVHIIAFVQWNNNPFFDGICACSEAAYIVMFVISLIILIYSPQFNKKKLC